MSGQHTPGPWTVCEHSWSRTGVYAKHVGIAALDIADEATEETQAEWEATMAANARLIAAAPELLEALSQAVEALRSADPNARMNALRDCRAVVAKATGEAV